MTTPAATRTAVLTSVMRGVSARVHSDTSWTHVTVAPVDRVMAHAVITGMGYRPEERTHRGDVVFSISADQLAA